MALVSCSLAFAGRFADGSRCLTATVSLLPADHLLQGIQYLPCFLFATGMGQPALSDHLLVTPFLAYGIERVSLLSPVADRRELHHLAKDTGGGLGTARLLVAAAGFFPGGATIPSSQTTCESRHPPFYPPAVGAPQFITR